MSAASEKPSPSDGEARPERQGRDKRRRKKAPLPSPGEKKSEDNARALVGEDAARSPDPVVIQAEITRWFRVTARDLPWRRTRDPYAVWVSEIMLQQTRVDTVVPRYLRWLDRFPTVSALAEAPLDEVLAEWAGLGYYARARNLHAAARLVQARYGGELPGDEAAIASLPGVGRYTTGAILSIAYGQRAPILDGNVARVLSRLHRVDGDPKSTPVQKRLWTLASSLVAAAEDPSHLNQGLMELGATVCAPRNPTCLLCPISRRCGAQAGGDAEAFPQSSAPQKVKAVEQVCVAIFRGDKVLLARRPPTGLWGGLYELPCGEPGAGEDPLRAAERIATERTGLSLDGALRPLPPPDDRFEQLLTHRRISFRTYYGHLHATRSDEKSRPPRVKLYGYDAHRFVLPSAPRDADVGVSRATERLLAALARLPSRK